MADNNIWKYADLTQKERLQMIRNGDNDVYEKEMARSNSLASARQSLGINEMDDINNWKTLISQAKEAYDINVKSASSFKTSPRTFAVRISSSNFNTYMNELKNKYKIDRTEAVNSAAAAKAELDEWLANNGLSVDGATASKRTARINTELDNKLSELEEDYKASVKKAKASYN